MAGKSKKPFLPQVLTANLLVGGEVVYLRADGHWSEELNAADVYISRGEADEGERVAADAVKDQKILDPYLFVVERSGNVIIPTSVREKIRASGPTVRLDLGRQAA
jgi:uncharacterized protein DUF2849